MPSPMEEASTTEDTQPILTAEGHQPPQPRFGRLRTVASAAVVVAALAALGAAARSASGGAPGGAARPSAAQELFHIGLGAHKAASADELPLIVKAEQPPIAAEDKQAAKDNGAKQGASRTMQDDDSQFVSARQEADPDAPLILATDGSEFKFSVLVNGTGLENWPTQKEIIIDGGGAFNFMVKEGQVEFVMNMLNGGETHVVNALKEDQMNAVTINKVNSTLFMTVGTDIKSVPCSGNMKIPGELLWGGEDEMLAKEYVQMEGNVPLSFTVKGIDDEKLHKMSSTLIEFENAVAASVAVVGGFGVNKEFVSVAHAQSPDGPGSTIVEVSAKQLGSMAPSVYQNLLGAAAPTTAVVRDRRRLSEESSEPPADSGDGEGEGEPPADSGAGVETETEAVSLADTLETRINAIPTIDDVAATPGEPVTVSDVSVPAESVNCDTWNCGPYMEALPGLTCAGGDCQSTCCGPRTCEQFNCSGLTNIAPTATCSDVSTCVGTCCATTCTGECEKDQCPNVDAMNKTVSISQYDGECCITPSTPCCTQKTALCLSCQVCMPPAEFCAAINAIPTRRLRGQYGSGDRGGQKLRPWWGRYTHRAEKTMAMRFNTTQNLVLDSMSTEATEFQLKVQEELFKQDLEERMAKFVGGGGAAGMQSYETFDANKQKILDGAAENIPPGCLGDDTPTCSWKLRSTFEPLEGSQGPATTVSVLMSGQRAIAGFRDSSNLYMFNLGSGKPDIPRGRHADGTLDKYGILVAGAAEGGTVTSSALMLDGSSGAVGYSNGGITVFNAGDVYYPPDTRDPASESSLESSAVNAIAGMPSWSTMLLAMSNGWTLMYQFNNGGIVRFPRNVSTLDETIALRQTMIKSAYKTRFGTGSNPPDPKEVEEFYASIPDIIEKHGGDISLLNKEALARASNQPYDSPVNDVVYVPASTKFATAHGDGKVRYWSSMNGNQLYQMAGHEGAVNALAAHPTKEIVASGGNDGTVRVWLFTGEGKQILLFDQKQGGPVRSLAFLPGGTTLVSGADDGVLRRYNVDSGERDCHTITYAGATTTMSADPLKPGQVAIGTASGTAMVYM